MGARYYSCRCGARDGVQSAPKALRPSLEVTTRVMHRPPAPSTSVASTLILCSSDWPRLVYVSLDVLQITDPMVILHRRLFFLFFVFLSAIGSIQTHGNTNRWGSASGDTSH